MTDTLHPIDKPKLFFIGIPAFTYLSENDFVESYNANPHDRGFQRHSHCTFDATAPRAGPTSDGFVINCPALLKLLRIMTANGTGVHQSVQSLFQSGDDQYRAFVWYLDVGTYLANGTKPLPHEYRKLRMLNETLKNWKK